MAAGDLADPWCARTTDYGGRTDRVFGHHCPAARARVRAAGDSSAGLHLGAGILVLRPVWLLLGARHLGPATRCGAALDTGLLGLVRGIFRVARGVLGATGRLLWRSELWLRVSGPWL